MIKPVGINIPVFKADTRSIDPKTGEYTDPLMKWPLRGMAFTNEVGESLRPLIGNYATLTWIPVLMYIGADIYDKYKNDQAEYSPNSRRCLKQAIFQGLASFILPFAAIKAGQNAFSNFGKITEDKITLNIKKHVSKTAEGFIADGKMHALGGKDKECKEEFLNRVHNILDFKNRKKIKPHYKNETKAYIDKYAEKTIKDLIEMRKKILSPDTQFKKDKWYKEYTRALKRGQTENVAIKTALSKFQKQKMMNGNLIKTLGGFTAFGLLIQPIDYFVEHILMDKYVGPRIDSIYKK